MNMRILLAGLAALLLIPGCNVKAGEVYKLTDSKHQYPQVFEETPSGECFLVTTGTRTPAKLHYSPDGKNWTMLEQDFRTRYVGANVHSIKFVTSDAGLFSTPAETYVTKDGGKTWKEHTRDFRAFDSSGSRIVALSQKGNALHILDENSLESERVIGEMRPGRDYRSWTDVELLPSGEAVMWANSSLHVWDGSSDDPTPLKIKGVTAFKGSTRNIKAVDAESKDGELEIWAALKAGKAFELVRLKNGAVENISLAELTNLKRIRSMKRLDADKGLLIVEIKNEGLKLFKTENNGENWTEGPALSKPKLGWRLHELKENGEAWLVATEQSEILVQKITVFGG